jgi:glyoxylase-like metal-dependent hydrolase (beta-lactamase superfamily II)
MTGQDTRNHGTIPARGCSGISNSPKDSPVTEVGPDRARFAAGRDGRKLFHPGDAPYSEIRWVDPQGAEISSYDLLPGVPKKLDRYVTRIIAPNAGVMTGAGTNTYLVGESELVVIDPGPADPAHIQAIVVAGAGRIRWILCTHTHVDHASAAAAIRQATGALIAGRPGPATPHDCNVVVDRVLADGDSVKCDDLSLCAIATPGHASNHLCYLLDRTRMLFTGDHIMQGSTVVIWPPDGNMRTYLDSLGRLLAFDISILAPGHGYLIGQPHAEAQRLIRHRLAREDKVRKAVLAAGGEVAPVTLLPRVYDDVPAAIHPIAARSLEAHLEKLVADGEFSCTDGRYSRR